MYDPRLQGDLTNKYEQVQPTPPHPTTSMVVMLRWRVCPDFPFSFKIYFQKEYLKKRSDIHQYDSNGNSGNSILFVYTVHI